MWFNLFYKFRLTLCVLLVITLAQYFSIHSFGFFTCQYPLVWSVTLCALGTPVPSLSSNLQGEPKDQKRSLGHYTREWILMWEVRVHNRLLSTCEGSFTCPCKDTRYKAPRLNVLWTMDEKSQDYKFFYGPGEFWTRDLSLIKRTR